VARGVPRLTEGRDIESKKNLQEEYLTGSASWKCEEEVYYSILPPRDTITTTTRLQQVAIEALEPTA
jgi:hypothetical protein